jgi:hypothetical protein
VYLEASLGRKSRPDLSRPGCRMIVLTRARGRTRCCAASVAAASRAESVCAPRREFAEMVLAEKLVQQCPGGHGRCYPDGIKNGQELRHVALRNPRRAWISMRTATASALEGSRRVMEGRRRRRIAWML